MRLGGAIRVCCLRPCRVAAHRGGAHFNAAIQEWLPKIDARKRMYLFRSRFRAQPHLSTRQYARIVHAWVESRDGQLRLWHALMLPLTAQPGAASPPESSTAAGSHLVLVAEPSLLAGRIIRKPEDLALLPTISMGEHMDRDRWDFVSAAGEERSHVHAPRLCCVDLGMLQRGWMSQPPSYPPGQTASTVLSRKCDSPLASSYRL
jgi:hypothetical protein